MPFSDYTERKHRMNLQRYGRQIEEIYATAVREVAAIGSSVYLFDPSRPFTFKDYPQTHARINSLLSRMQQDIQIVIVNGIDAEWTLCNNKNSELANWVFGKALKNLPQSAVSRYYNNNEAAREAFLSRKYDGLGLSDRVWKYSKQFQQEIEMGLDLGIRNGLSAEEIARDLRQYLNQPDKLFRRVRDEHGQLQLSKNAAAYNPGAGVYRSSHKNAVRLARTETNMAYRTSDNTRWEQLTFVVGQQVSLSGNHPVHDICDILAGKYPKSFLFRGWHPNCMCFATPILKTTEELKAETQRIISGENVSTESRNEITTVPAGFRSWVKENEGRISAAKHEPYFIQDNRQFFSMLTN